MKGSHPVNLFVRECLTRALFQLMEQRDIGDISVTLLVKTAGVSRNSFYRNYRSMEDILRQYLTDQTRQWWTAYTLHPHPEVIREVFQHLLHMQAEIRLLYRSGLSHLLMEHIILCGRESLTGELRNAYQTAFFSGGLCGLVNEWALRDMRETPEQMQALFLAQRQTEPQDG